MKCNPTILGYETARRILDGMGYDYIVFDDHHFREDLQWADAVPMFERLQALADSKGLEFGLKLSNTFPVDTTRGELPNNEMYMSGRSLFPLTIEMCHRISRQFKGKMRISLRRRRGVFQLRQAVRGGHLAHHRCDHHPQARRLQPPAPDGGEGRAHALQAL